MASPQNHWKLGLFVVAGLAMALVTVALLAARGMHQEVGLYVSYFDESVQGLEVGAPIKFRGVTIGTVGKIMVAPDHRHVEVESELSVEQLSRLGLDVAKAPGPLGTPKKLEQTVDLRLQLASSGLTGVKFLQLDFFDVNEFPSPELPFPAPANYIPTASSMMKDIESSLTRMANRLPDITDQIVSILDKIDAVVSEVNERQIPEKVATTLGTVDDFIVVAQKKLEQVDTGGLSQNAKQTLAGVTTAVVHLDGLVAHIDQDDGLLSSVTRTSDIIGDTLRNVDGLGGQLAETLMSLQTAARSIRKFTEALEQDPDMLLKGRSPEIKR